MSRRIALVGPESCGKTTLARELAAELAAPWVPEFARSWFAARGSSDYTLDDIVAIARGQLALEDELASPGWLVCDTNVLVCVIWAEVRFGQCPPELAMLWRPQDYALHLLLSPDLPWQPDPLRENPLDREQLFELYRQGLQIAGVPFAEVSGSGAQRLACAQAALASLGTTGR
ncbi:AAA family ATPase [Chitinilyticum litopenaei]|uniref:AAA family ATPase n=1 Tax=Chitinilyticum litopenaei TaxID=1121276 RepID=UPI000411C2F7|nr:ATP-binding protein [Chitinilyticum litopenaei]